MKNLLFTITFFLTTVGFAQVLIDDSGTGTAPHSAAALEVKSASKGVLVSRLASDPEGVAGLIYFNTTVKCYKIFNGINWNCLITSPFRTEYKLSIADPTPVTEATTQNFTVTLTPALVAGDKVTVNFSTKQTNSATEGSDYTKKTGTLTFNIAGQTTQNIEVITLADSNTESDENYILDLSNATVSVTDANVSITRAEAIGVINNGCNLPIVVSTNGGVAPNNINEHIISYIREADLSTKYDLNIVPAGSSNPSTPMINDITLIAGSFPSYTPYFYVSKSNPYGITLTRGNTYDVYVRKDCGSNNTQVSNWVKQTVTINN